MRPDVPPPHLGEESWIDLYRLLRRHGRSEGPDTKAHDDQVARC
jgi:hypothetical protein